MKDSMQLSFCTRRLTRIALLASLATIAYASAVPAYEARLRPQFERLDPQTRLEEVCNTVVAATLNRDNKHLRADKVVAYTFAAPETEGDRLKAGGAAFRSSGKWFRLRFECETNASRLDVQHLSYEIGDEIEKADWQRYYLYD
jgi:hypothetical protein